MKATKPNLQQGKLIVISAPSGTGKSTLIQQYLLTLNLDFEFSISATCRQPRGDEKNGVEYYFISTDDFKNRITKGEFIEYEEVYPNCYYGTLHSEVDRICSNGKNIIFDIDVAGALNIKEKYKEKALLIFIAPPSIETLRERLTNRKTDTNEMIEKRLAKANYEISFSPQFDTTIINDDIQQAGKQLQTIVQAFVQHP